MGSSPNNNFSASDNGPRFTSMCYTELSQAMLNGIPHLASQHFETAADLKVADFLPKEAKVARQYRGKWQEIALASVTDQMWVLNHMKGESFDVHIASPDLLAAEAEVARIAAKIPEKINPENVISSRVWYNTNDGPTSSYKDLTVPSWTEIERNYPNPVAASLTQLMKMGRPTDSSNMGRIVLWYGEPGVGKTTALRALGREWKDWCNMHYISDPEALFGSPGYLMQVGGEGGDEPWRLIVAEDTDAFLHAGKGGSAAMGRLLNFSDGILGQGTNTLFLLTTNEPIAKLHPAIIRPGRCLAQIEFNRFTQHEATEWLGGGISSPSGDKTLAELIELQKKNKKILNESTAEATGMYL